ncbi:type-F conjugative transfer system pilin acetylase TraX [Klebsiella pneumoniae]|nr:type-F conjugative transfer system pilin acetylase TraX [Klebsiella pneumoniae]
MLTPAGCFVAHSMHRNGWDTGCCGPHGLLMNMHDVSESVAGLAIALLTLMVCSSAENV